MPSSRPARGDLSSSRGNTEDQKAAGVVAISSPGTGARYRHFGAAPLIEDNSVRSDPTTVINLELGYRFAKRFAVSLAAYNLFDSDDNDITYFYEGQLPGEGAPVEDRHFHPVEPRTLRLTVETRW